MPSYQTIPTTRDEESSLTGTLDTIGSTKNLPVVVHKKWAVGLVAVLLGVVLVVLRMGDNTSTATMPELAMEGAPHTRSCTFDECWASNCNPTAAPYTCLLHNGGPHGGCSATPWLPETCDDQCDLSDCSDLEIPDTTESCDAPCTKEFCASGRLCGSAVPYQCTSGSSTYGCSADEFQWTLRTSDTTCGSCCNVESCA